MAYVLVLIIHIFVAFLSDSYDKRGTPGDNNRYSELMGLNVTVCVITMICWCVLMQNTSSNSGMEIESAFSTVVTNVQEDELDENIN